MEDKPPKDGHKTALNFILLAMIAMIAMATWVRFLDNYADRKNMEYYIKSINYEGLAG